MKPPVCVNISWAGLTLLAGAAGGDGCGRFGAFFQHYNKSNSSHETHPDMQETPWKDAPTSSRTGRPLEATQTFIGSFWPRVLLACLFIWPEPAPAALEHRARSLLCSFLISGFEIPFFVNPNESAVFLVNRLAPWPLKWWIDDNAFLGYSMMHLVKQFNCRHPSSTSYQIFIPH